jgi:hypothetical protein
MNAANKQVSFSWIAFTAFTLIVLNLFLTYLLYKLLPVESIKTGVNILSLFSINPSEESRMILLVCISGALGSYVHAATSFVYYVGNKQFYSHWMWWYLLRPFIGIALALVFYFAIRAGLFNASSSPNDLNLYGILTIAGLTGMFSKQATNKLNELFDNMFKTDKSMFSEENEKK